MPTHKQTGLTKGYLLALCLIGILMLTGHFIVQSVINEHLADIQLVNVAGRQRVLSQQISKLVLELNYTDTSDIEKHPHLVALDTSLQVFEKTQQGLKGELHNSNPDLLSKPYIQELLAQQQPHYEAIKRGVHQVVDASRTDLAPAQFAKIKEGIQLILAHEQGFLHTMEQLVAAYESESDKRIETLIQIERILLGAGLLLLVIAAIFIFRPMVQRTNKAFEGLEQSLKALSTTESELQISNEKLKESQSQLNQQNKALKDERKRLEIQQVELQQNQDHLAGMMMELREKNIEIERLSLVTERTTNLVIITDAEQRIEWVNPSFEKVSGYTLQEVKGRVPGHFLQGPDTNPDTIASIRKRLNGQEKVEIEILNYSKSGKPYWVQMSITPLFNNRGTLNGFFAVERDVTKRRKAEEQLRQAYSELQVREEELTQQAEELNIINEKLHAASENAKAQLVAVEQLQKAIFKSGSIVITDTGGKILEVNDRFCHNCGYEPEELVGMPIQLLDSDFHGEVFWEDVMATIQEGGGWRGEVCNKAKDGSLYWTDKAITPIFNVYGKVHRYITIERNITDKKELERLQVLELERSEMANYIMSQTEGTHQEKLEIAMMVATRYLGMERGIISAINFENDEYTILAAYDTNEKLKKGDILSTSDSYCNMMLSANKNSMFFEDIEETDYKDQHCYKVFGLKSYLGIRIDYHGKTLGTLNFTSSKAIGKKITHADQNFVTLLGQWVEHILEQKYYEDELIDKARKLEESSRQANEALAQLQKAQQQLVQSEKMSSLGVLTAGIAHEINNPVNFVSGGVAGIETCWEDLQEVWYLYESLNMENALEILPKIEALKNELEYDDTKNDMFELLKDIEIGANRIAVIVRNLKVFSHSGNSQYTKANLPENIEATLSILNSKLEHRIDIIQEYDKHLPDIQCNIGEINQVIMNLIGNAADAIKGHGTITIKACVPPNENNICLSISDTGVGISPEHLSKIFEPFFSTKDVGTGTGLGLSISYGIIKDHNGELTVESEVGVGTTFKMILPIERKTDIASAAEE